MRRHVELSVAIVMTVLWIGPTLLALTAANARCKGDALPLLTPVPLLLVMGVRAIRPERSVAIALGAWAGFVALAFGTSSMPFPMRQPELVQAQEALYRGCALVSLAFSAAFFVSAWFERRKKIVTKVVALAYLAATIMMACADTFLRSSSLNDSCGG